MLRGETSGCRNVLSKCPAMYEPYTVTFPLLLEKPLSWCPSCYSLLQYFRPEEKSPKGLAEYWGCSPGTALKSFIGGSACYGLGLIFSNIINASDWLVLLSENLLSSNCFFFFPSTLKKAFCPVKARGGNNNVVFTVICNSKQRKRGQMRPYCPKARFRF